MKLQNISLLVLTSVLFIVMGLWSVYFYFDLIDEVNDSLDDGLSNSKYLIIQKAINNREILQKDNFGESNYAFKPIPVEKLNEKDRHSDTLIYTQNESDYEPFRMLTTHIQIGSDEAYELKIITSMVEEDDLVEDLMYSILIFYIIIIVVVVLLNRLFLAKIWRPFYALLDNIKKFKIGVNEKIHEPKTKIKEFHELYAAIAKLKRENVNIYKQQNHFISSASHELQTPLAISINKLELLLENGSLTREDAVKIDAITQSLEKLVKINRSLLLISKIESSQYKTAEKIHLNEVIQNVLSKFQDLADYKAVSIVTQSEQDLYYKMNPELAEVLFQNLIKNAIHYNTPKGQIKISITNHKVIIENTGIDAPLDQSKLYQRFNKNMYHKQSTGLGLSIVKSICDLYQIEISYQFKSKHVFILHFPTA